MQRWEVYRGQVGWGLVPLAFLAGDARYAGRALREGVDIRGITITTDTGYTPPHLHDEALAHLILLEHVAELCIGPLTIPLPPDDNLAEPLIGAFALLILGHPVGQLLDIVIELEQVGPELKDGFVLGDDLFDELVGVAGLDVLVLGEQPEEAAVLLPFDYVVADLRFERQQSLIILLHIV